MSGISLNSKTQMQNPIPGTGSSHVKKYLLGSSSDKMTWSPGKTQDVVYIHSTQGLPHIMPCVSKNKNSGWRERVKDSLSTWHSEGPICNAILTFRD